MHGHISGRVDYHSSGQKVRETTLLWLTCHTLQLTISAWLGQVNLDSVVVWSQSQVLCSFIFLTKGCTLDLHTP